MTTTKVETQAGSRVHGVCMGVCTGAPVAEGEHHRLWRWPWLQCMGVCIGATLAREGEQHPWRIWPWAVAGCMGSGGPDRVNDACHGAVQTTSPF